MNQQAVDALEKLGFSTYEARVYIGLLKSNPVNGYQLSKLSGVPRSRIYETLDRLTARGYAVALQSDPMEFKPLAPNELLAQLQEQFDGALSILDKELSQIETNQENESTWNLRGRDSILQRARTMIARSQESVYVVGWGETLENLKPALEEACQRGVRAVIISCGDFDFSGGRLYRHAFEAELVSQCDTTINLVVDGMEVLIGSTQPADTCEAAWSHNQALIQITEEYIRHEVYLQKIVERFGSTHKNLLREALIEGSGEVPNV